MAHVTEQELKSIVGRPYKTTNTKLYGFGTWKQETITGYKQLWHGGYEIQIDVLGSDDKIHKYSSQIQFSSEVESIKRRFILTFEALKNLWEEFADVPIDKDECIEENFHIWEKGTNRYEIWHWFDDRLPNGLAKDLMGL